MSFFYQRALESEPEGSVHADDFRYPGPRPRSKEAALIMCAAAVEAAVRSLKGPGPDHIRSMVTRLVDQRAHEGELDESGITLADLAVIKERLVSVMTTVYHRRVAYPGQEIAREPSTAPSSAPDDWSATDESVAESG
jgi:membrane-associated HD superfamily phosphohydrolase